MREFVIDQAVIEACQILGNSIMEAMRPIMEAMRALIDLFEFIQGFNAALEMPPAWHNGYAAGRSLFNGHQ